MPNINIDKPYKSISPKMVSTAIFEYLENRGYQPDRKKGAETIDGYYFVQLKERHSNDY